MVGPEVEIVRLGIVRHVVAQPPVLPRRQRDGQGIDDLSREVVLKLEDVGQPHLRGVGADQRPAGASNIWVDTRT